MTIATIIIAAACFTAAVLNLATEHPFRNRIMTAFFTASVLLGLAIYGYGYAYVDESASVAVLRAVMSVCLMFGGSNDLESIASAPLFAQNWVIVLFWIVHFMAFYAMAGAIFATIGSKLLRRIRMALAKRGTLLVIYGVNANAVEYGTKQMDVLHRSVVFIGQGDTSLEEEIDAAGGVVERHGEQPDRALLRRLGIRPGKRPIEVAALHEDGMKNAAFVRTLLTALEKRRIHPEQTKLLIRDIDEDQAGTLIASEKAYGYGSVMAFSEYEVVARLMVQNLPPCDTIHFDKAARAKDNFHALIIGFGQMGRAALNALLMNGQFHGSTFRADVFDPDPQCGVLYDHEILRQYDIRFHQAGGKSEALYAFLAEHMDALRYVVLCTGKEKENREIARDLGRWLRERGAAPAIVECTSRSLAFTPSGGDTHVCKSIYSSDTLDLERIDSMAMAINHAYCSGTGKTPRENWKHCSYFSRMSSRASADFYPAVLRAAGKTVHQVEAGQWPPQIDALENLAITEHMRWCAFHYVMGFRPMSEAEYTQRIEQYRAEMQAKGRSSLRIAKDTEHKKHACLTPWEHLDQCSRQENAVTGGHVDYKQLDRNNILALPDILAVLRDMP